MGLPGSLGSRTVVTSKSLPALDNLYCSETVDLINTFYFLQNDQN